MSKEIKIGKRTIIGENTKISLSVSTALWIVSAFLFVFSCVISWMYYDIKKEVKSYKESVQNNIDNKMDKIADKQEQFLQEIGEVKGNVKVILDRTSNLRGGSNANAGITPENNRPQ